MPDQTDTIRLLQIIREAQKLIQMGADMREVWNALYVPKDLADKG